MENGGKEPPLSCPVWRSLKCKGSRNSMRCPVRKAQPRGEKGSVCGDGDDSRRSRPSGELAFPPKCKKGSLTKGRPSGPWPQR